MHDILYLRYKIGYGKSKDLFRNTGRRRNPMKLHSLICLLLAVLFILSACSGGQSPADETDDTTDITTESGNGTNADGTLALTWARGSVSSDPNAASVIRNGTTMYSYTNVFTIPRAGTRITFVDTPASGSGGSGYASGSVYVFSFWKQDAQNEWVLDDSFHHFPGVGYTESVISSITGDKELTYTYITAKDNENIRICYHSGELKNDTNVPYPAVTAVWTGEKSTMEIYKEDGWYSQLEGITLNVIGDSYFAGEGLDPNKEVWPALLAQKYNMSFTNHGIGGSTMCVTQDNKNPIVRRYQNLPNNNPDIVILEGGRNDRNQNNAGKGAAIGENNTTDETTFKGALTATIRGLKAKYPNALILCVTVWRVNDGTTEYGTAMKEVCAYEGVPCFDSTNQELSTVYMTDPSFREQYCQKPSDVSHLNLAGMKRVMPVFEKFIAEEYAKFLNR